MGPSSSPYSKAATLEGASVVFDLDGTLVDTAGDLAASLNHVLEAAGRSTVDAQSVRMLVGHGARVLLHHGFAQTGEPLPVTAMEPYVARFLAHYAEHVAVVSAPFPGARSALERLSAAGARLGICTNKPEALSRALLEALDLTRYFPAVLGADSLDVRKPNPRHLTETVRRLGGDASRVVFIGDSPVDVATARAATVPVIAVTFGYTPVPPEELGADALIGHFDELDEPLLRLLEGAR